MDIFLYVLSALIGACFGSFANLIIYRVPLGKSIVSPRSYCVDCNHQIRFYENIPILSCLILGAKCSKCKKSFGWRSLVVEVMMSLLFICLVKQYLGSYLMWEYLIFGFAMICISFIDIDHRIIPDSFNIGGLLIGLIGAAINPEREFLDALLGVLFGGGFFWLISYLYFILRGQIGMGGGDIKLLAWIGAVLGWQSLLFVIMFSSIFGSLVGLGLAIGSQKGIRSSIPFGPYLAAGAVAYIFLNAANPVQWLDIYFNF